MQSSLHFVMLLNKKRPLTVYEENIVTRIGGFAVRNILKSLHCAMCAEAPLGRDNHREYCLSSIHIKDNGGLVIPSDDVFKILKNVRASSFHAFLVSKVTTYAFPVSLT